MGKPSVALERRLTLVRTGEEMCETGTTVKVAFATSDMKRVDQHFGAADSFAVYALTCEQASLTEAVQFGPELLRGYEGDGWVQSSAERTRFVSPLDTSGHHENKLAAKIDALDGCVAVYCQAVGASTINQLSARGIQAVKVAERSEIKDLLKALQEELRDGPNSWVGRAIEQRKPHDRGRFDRMEQEGWVE
jgi:nitrogen fixation protein NifX